ncbi:hypothetical protein EBR66_02120 [bacterium]|nr:hypothetical protein [bacterium]
MSNVLPPEYHADVRAATRSSFALLVASSLAVILAVVLIVSMPAYFAATAPRISVVETATTTQDIATMKKELASDQQVLTLFSALPHNPSIAIALGTLLREKPKSITILSVSYTSASNKKGKGVLQVSGTAKSREALGAYRAALIKKQMFDAVSIPIGALVGTDANTFDLSVTGTF